MTPETLLAMIDNMCLMCKLADVPADELAQNMEEVSGHIAQYEELMDEGMPAHHQARFVWRCLVCENTDNCTKVGEDTLTLLEDLNALSAGAGVPPVPAVLMLAVRPAPRLAAPAHATAPPQIKTELVLRHLRKGKAYDFAKFTVEVAAHFPEDPSKGRTWASRCVPPSAWPV